MWVVSSDWFDWVLLSVLYTFKPPCWLVFKPPSLGPPWLPLNYWLSSGPEQHHARVSAALRVVARGYARHRHASEALTGHVMMIIIIMNLILWLCVLAIVVVIIAVVSSSDTTLNTNDTCNHSCLAVCILHVVLTLMIHVMLTLMLILHVIFTLMIHVIIVV